MFKYINYVTVKAYNLVVSYTLTDFNLSCWNFEAICCNFCGLVRCRFVLDSKENSQNSLVG